MRRRRARPRPAAALVVAALLAAPPVHARSGRTGIGAGFFVPTALRVDGARADATPGMLVEFRLDRPVAEALDVGLFLQMGAFTADAPRHQVNFAAFGAAAHWVLALAPQTVLRLGGGLGFRRLFADLHRYDGVNGVAVEGQAILSYALSPHLTVFAEVGVLTQPLGTNGDHDVTWLPFPSLTLGAEF